MNGPSSVEYKVLVTYFKTMYIDLSPALMENVVGDMSMLGFMVNSLQQTVINTYSHGTSLDDTTLVAIQWGTSSFLDNT
jgi:ABC-type enterochelin transport system permease subunit